MLGSGRLRSKSKASVWTEFMISSQWPPLLKVRLTTEPGLSLSFNGLLVDGRLKSQRLTTPTMSWETSQRP